jgi:hypothetical protein
MRTDRRMDGTILIGAPRGCEPAEIVEIQTCFVYKATLSAKCQLIHYTPLRMYLAVINESSPSGGVCRAAN